METNSSNQIQSKPKNKKLPFIIGGIILIVGFFAGKKIYYSMNHEDTENSQIESNMSPVAARLQGYITEISVGENQLVNKGDTLVRIDDRDYQLKVKQAEINLENAKANLDVIKSNAATADAGSIVGTSGIETAKANVEAAKIKLWKSQQDYNRYENLLEEKSVTQQQFESIKADKETSEKQLDAVQKQLAVVIEQSKVSSLQSSSADKQVKIAELQIEQRQAELDVAKLNLSYTVLLAPYNGYVAKKNIQIGQLVNPGQSLMSVVDIKSVWITANFKETQVRDLKEGQLVKIAVDAYPGVEFKGTIESLSPATGSRFSLIPADNASGNFVKVVQRIPVRIAVKNDDKQHPLRAGMNAAVAVDIN